MVMRVTMFRSFLLFLSIGFLYGEVLLDAQENSAEGIIRESANRGPARDSYRVYSAWWQAKRPPMCPNIRATRKCSVSVPNRWTSRNCRAKRVKDVKKSQQFYKLTTHLLPPPMDTIPFLNQSKEAVSLHTSLDHLDSRWLAFFSMILKFVEKMNAGLTAQFGQTTFKKPEDYIKMWAMHNMMIQQFGVGDIFSNPAISPSFTDVIHNGRYLTDEVFVQMRLAGVCPFLIRKVTNNPHVGMEWRDLKGKLNSNYKFEIPLRVALKDSNEWTMTLEQAVKDGRLYVLYSEEFNGVPTEPDFLGKTLLDLTTPITLFVRTPSGDLKVVAIQTQDVPTSPVYTPYYDKVMWARAKDLVNTVDTAVCQAVWHLSHIHFSVTKYCAIFRSHFSVYHPIHQVMQYHCEGTTPHIVLTYEKLLADSGYAGNINSISNEGYQILAAEGHKKFTYDTTDFELLLQRQGLESNDLKYHPFRDDGKLVFSTFKEFARDFTNMYYRFDWQVRGDKELQSFASQVAVGTKGEPYGAKANIQGFPQSFQTKAQVETLITRLVWQIALHSVTNYPLEPYGSFIPAGPTKLYKPVTENDRWEGLPDKETTKSAILFITILANARINRMFDYHNKLTDSRLQGLVRKYYERMHTCVQNTLAKRNEARKGKKLMGLQYLEPKWLTNSVHV